MKNALSFLAVPLGVAILGLIVAVGAGNILAQTTTETDGANDGTVGDITICGRPGTNIFNACYYQGQNFNAFQMQRTDSQINFDWATGSPHEIIEPNAFSARWLGLFEFEEGTYEFTVTADDGVRLHVDNETIIDEWVDQPATTYTVQKEMPAGQRGVIVEYYENRGDAVIQVGWQRIDDDTEQPQPPSSTQYDPHSWLSTYYALPGDSVTVYGVGFAPNETVQIEDQDGNTLGTVTVNRNGQFTARGVIDVPDAWEGETIDLVISGEDSGTVDAPNMLMIGLEEHHQ